MTDHALNVLREVHAQTATDVPFSLVQRIHEIEREYQYEDDPQVRHSAIRTLVTLAVDEMMKADDSSEVKG